MRRFALVFTILLVQSIALYSQTTGDLFLDFRKAESAKDWVRAESIAREGMARYPDEVGFVNCLCYSLRMQKRPSEALAVIEPAFAKNQRDRNLRDNYVYSMIDVGWDLSGNKEYEKAYAYFRKAYELAPRDPWSVNAFGYILAQVGKKEESITILKKAMADFPLNTSISDNLVSSLLSFGWDDYTAKDYAAALNLFKEAFAIKPDDEWVLNALGVVLRETGELDSAIEHLERGYQKSPANAYLKDNLLWAYILKANSLKDSGSKIAAQTTAEIEAVEAWYKKAGALDSGADSYLLNYGIFLNEAGRFKEARAVLEKGEMLFPADLYYIDNIQYSYQEEERALAAKKEYGASIALIHKARSRFPNEIWFILDLADDYFALKDYAKSMEALVAFAENVNLEEFRKLPAFGKEEPAIYRSSGLIWKFAELKDFTSGFALLDKLEAALPGSYFPLEQRGVLLFESGEKEKGIASVNKAYDQYIATHTEAKKTIRISLPLKGTFLVYGNNRSDAVTHAGLNRFCFDFMGSDSQGNLQKPGAVFPGKNSDYYGFGASLYSPVDGLVEDVVDLYEDVTPRAEAMLGDGNSVTIKDASGYHYLFAHIKKGSARVAKGQEVKAGDVLAELGNTGYTAYPHFHFGVYTPDWRVSLEVKFSSYTILAKDGTEKKVLDGTPQTGEVIKN